MSECQTSERSLQGREITSCRQRKSRLINSREFITLRHTKLTFRNQHPEWQNKSLGINSSTTLDSRIRDVLTGFILSQVVDYNLCWLGSNQLLRKNIMRVAHHRRNHGRSWNIWISLFFEFRSSSLERSKEFGDDRSNIHEVLYVNQQWQGIEHFPCCLPATPISFRTRMTWTDYEGVGMMV